LSADLTGWVSGFVGFLIGVGLHFYRKRRRGMRPAEKQTPLLSTAPAAEPNGNHEQLLHPEGRYVPHVDLISPKDMDAIHKYLALTKNARGEILKELPPDKVKQILDGLPKE
jgi:hypothetical protein